MRFKSPKGECWGKAGERELGCSREEKQPGAVGSLGAGGALSGTARPRSAAARRAGLGAASGVRWYSGKWAVKQLNPYRNVLNTPTKSFYVWNSKRLCCRKETVCRNSYFLVFVVSLYSNLQLQASSAKLSKLVLLPTLERKRCSFCW